MKNSKTTQITRKKDYKKKVEFIQENPEKNNDTNSREKSDQLKNQRFEKLDINSPIISSYSTNLQEKVQSQNSEESNDISFMHNLKNYYAVKFLGEKKNIIIRVIALVFGILFIVYGVIFSFTGSSVQVASNVLFGDRAMFSALLVLIGSLIIATVFARELREVTFLKTLYNELETFEGDTQRNKDESLTEEDEGNDND